MQKKENPRSTELPAWVDVNVLQRNDFTNENGETKHRIVCINPYFQEHPEMVLGKLEIVSGAYGPQLVCKPFADADLGEMLSEAIQNISAQITEYEVEELVETEDHSIRQSRMWQIFRMRYGMGKFITGKTAGCVRWNYL